MICQQCKESSQSTKFGYCVKCAKNHKTIMKEVKEFSLEERIRLLRRRRVESKYKRGKRHEHSKRAKDTV
jgi:hypothetical protein